MYAICVKVPAPLFYMALWGSLEQWVIGEPVRGWAAHLLEVRVQRGLVPACVRAVDQVVPGGGSERRQVVH